MKLTIQKVRTHYDGKERFIEIEEFEIESFRWDVGHEFAYVRKGGARWEKLEPNEDIMGLDI